MKKTIFLLIIFFILFGCISPPEYTPLSEDELKYVGTWSNDEHLLVIYPNGSADYNYEGYNEQGAKSTFYTSEMPMSITDGNINLEYSIIKKQFVITKDVYFEDGETFIELNNIIFKKEN
jgi:hypothetical protein